MFLVTDATGHVGRAVLAELAGHPVAVRALQQEGFELPAQASNIETVTVDPEDAASLQKAMQGVEAVFLSAHISPQIVESQMRYVAAARSAGVKRLVQLSGVGADAGLCCTRVLRWLGEAETSVAAAGLPVTVLRPTYLMQLLLEFSASISQQGLIAGPFRSSNWTWVDARDVAAVAIAALKDPAHAGQRYIVTGSESKSWQQVAEQISKVLERPVRYTDITANEARGWLQAKGVPPVMIEAKLELWDACASSWINVAPNSVVKDLTGREPRTIDDFVREYRKRFLTASAA
jgi:uncharacterized protein YbjT (DUF2867 family)